MGLPAILMATLALGAGPDPSGDAAKIQGRWEACVGGRQEIKVVLDIDGPTVEATVMASGLTVRARGEVRIDEAASPRALDWRRLTMGDGEELPEIRSIYRIEGDRLVVRAGGFAEGRPKAFEAGDGYFGQVVVFERR